MFGSSVPVVDQGFHDRESELASLRGLVQKLRGGTPGWLALIGPRKVGKTSLLMELARRERAEDLRFVVIDALDSQPISLEFFRLTAARVLDAMIGADVGVSLELLLHDPPGFRAALQGSASFARLRPADRSGVLELPERKADDALIRFALELPERIAAALELFVIFAIDEFQELATLVGARGTPDPFPIMRSTWQRHRRVGYVVSGSARSMLTELVSSERSPFFQHFAIAELGPFAREVAVALLVEESPQGREISAALAEQAFATIGGHPFYLQLLGEAITARPPPYDTRTLKECVQELLFSRTGRLALYFENELARSVGRSAHLATTLDALAAGAHRITDIAAAIGQTSGATVRYVERLGDIVQRDAEGHYAIDDALFAAWIRWRRPGGSVVPMTMLGNDAERAAAERLARMGFDLVYQSRASRGAFDLLALRGATSLGVQVKRTTLPLRFLPDEWARMDADARRFGWRWLIAAVHPDGDVQMLDPDKARRGREIRLSDDAIIENVLVWLDRAPRRRAKR